MNNNVKNEGKNSLQIIDEREVLGKQFRIFGDIENPLFLAKDVAIWIEYDLTSVHKLVGMVDDSERVRKNVPTPGGDQEMWFLTEDGLYEVLMQSRKPIAKEFKKKVKEILRTIRKHGAYMTPDTLDKMIASPEFGIKLLTALKEEREKNRILSTQIEEAKPKVEFFDAVAESKDAISIGECAKVLNMGIGRNKLFEFLRQQKILRENNEPYQKYIDLGYFRQIEQKWHTPEGDTKIYIKTLVYQKGLDFIRKLLIEKGVSRI